jgi:hypothetical protein
MVKTYGSPCIVGGSLLLLALMLQETCSFTTSPHGSSRRAPFSVSNAVREVPQLRQQTCLPHESSLFAVTPRRHGRNVLSFLQLAAADDDDEDIDFDDDEESDSKASADDKEDEEQDDEDWGEPPDFDTEEESDATVDDEDATVDVETKTKGGKGSKKVKAAVVKQDEDEDDDEDDDIELDVFDEETDDDDDDDDESIAEEVDGKKQKVAASFEDDDEEDEDDEKKKTGRMTRMVSTLLQMMIGTKTKMAVTIPWKMTWTTPITRAKRNSSNKPSPLPTWQFKRNPLMNSILSWEK